MKKVVITLLIIAIVIGGGFIAYKYFTREDDMKSIPSTYENLQFGSSYEDVYNDACNRGETIVKEHELKKNKAIMTTRDGYENVDGTVKIMYLIDNTNGLTDVMISFEKDKCKQGLKKIYNSYKKRLNKYCDALDDKELIWTNKDGISYQLSDSDDKVSFTISKFNLGEDQ